MICNAPAISGPRFVIVTVYWSVSPVAASVSLTIFVTAMSESCANNTSMMTESELLPGWGSSCSERVTAAWFSMELPAVPEFTMEVR